MECANHAKSDQRHAISDNAEELASQKVQAAVICAESKDFSNR